MEEKHVWKAKFYENILLKEQIEANKEQIPGLPGICIRVTSAAVRKNYKQVTRLQFSQARWSAQYIQ